MTINQSQPELPFSGDHSMLSPETYRAIDAELAAAEREMADSEEQLRLLHERQERKRKQGKLFG